MKIENTVFSKNNCEFYSRSIVSGWIGIIKMDKEDSNTFPEKKYVQKWVIGTHSILGIEWVIAEETMKIALVMWEKRINIEKYYRWKDRNHRDIVKVNNVISR